MNPDFRIRRTPGSGSRILRTGSLAAAAATLAGVSRTEATPVFVQINEVIPAGTSRSYDVDGDGMNDITLDATLTDILMSGLGGTCGTSACTSAVILDPLDPALLVAFETGELIGVTTGTGSGTVQLGLSALANEADSGPFFENNPPVRFAGFQFRPGRDQYHHWGWAQISVTPDFDLEVLAFGWEDQYVTPIPAGFGTAGATATGAVAVEAALLQNAPNPFQKSTRISYQLEADRDVAIRIYDVSGRIVRNLEATGRAGTNSVEWNGRDDSGRRTVAGLYYYRLESPGLRTPARRLILID